MLHDRRHLPDPGISAAIMGVLTGAGVYMMSVDMPDNIRLALAGMWMLLGAWMGYGGTRSLDSEIIKAGQDNNAPPTTLDDKYPELEKTAEMRMAQYATSSGLSYRRVIPPLPDKIKGMTSQRWKELAWGLMRENRPLTVREWCGDGRPLAYQGQYTAIIEYMTSHKMIEQAGRGVRLTQAGRLWMEQIIAVYGPLTRR